MAEATNHSYVDVMLDGRTGTPEVRFQHRTMSWGEGKEVRNMRGGGGEPVKGGED